MSSKDITGGEESPPWPYGPEVEADGSDRTDYTALQLPEPTEDLPPVAEATPESAAVSERLSPAIVTLGGKKRLILASGDVSDVDVAEAVFQELGKRRELFVQGKQVVEIREDPETGMAELVRVGVSALRTRVSLMGPVYVYRKRGNSFDLTRGRCSEEMAKAMLCSRAVQTFLPKIQLVVNCPVITEDEAGNVHILPKGYHPLLGGLFITNGRKPPTVPLDTAIRFIVRAFADFDAVTACDIFRMWANVITIGLKLGGVLPFHAPIQYCEASRVGSGKSYLQELTAAFYNEIPWVATQRPNGVGGLDETIAQGMAYGRTCIKIDNVDEELRSQYLLSAVSHDRIPVRVPYRREIEVDPGRHVFFINTNGAEITPDRGCPENS